MSGIVTVYWIQKYWYTKPGESTLRPAYIHIGTKISSRKKRTNLPLIGSVTMKRIEVTAQLRHTLFYPLFRMSVPREAGLDMYQPAEVLVWSANSVPAPFG